MNDAGRVLFLAQALKYHVVALRFIILDKVVGVLVRLHH